MNLFPAILLAGPPNCGKSVLAYLLTQHLRTMEIPHYLLRAAPDGEGDWFLQGRSDVVRTLRLNNKRPYSSAFVAHMRGVIQNRWLPLLVDVGGKPQGEQNGILRACTHAILLTRTAEEAAAWKQNLAEMGLTLLADLRSTLERPGALTQVDPCLQGDISGLARHNPAPDMTFGALLDRVAGLCRYDAQHLEQIHLRQAPFTPLVERLLMKQLDPARAAFTPHWQPADLKALQSLVTPGQPAAIYGRGPTWLAAMRAAHALPAEAMIFDARYGWLPIPELAASDTPTLPITHRVVDGVDWWECSLPLGVVEPNEISMALPPGQHGVILSGRLPRWVYAAWVRAIAAERPWVAVYDASRQAAVVVHSHSPALAVGEERPVQA
jgi:CRISPR-associated protein Csx3